MSSWTRGSPPRRALAGGGDALGALKWVALREDPPALALRGIAMAQLGEYPRARKLLRSAARGFGAREELSRARCDGDQASLAQSPIRFHVRFFAVEAGRLTGKLAGNGELLDLAWRPVEACLKLPIVDVTEFLLRRLLEGPPASGPAVSLFSFRKGRAVLDQAR